ncbi:hypothetical protein IL306_009282 [Fusarium sp. DS 682]|nr:hypothetical protein IL306_009282 [Fusarium sp. DS 682]
MLVHSRYYKTPLVKEFAILMDNLTDMSNRWAGHEQAKQMKKSPNFFDQLFDRLQKLHHEFHVITTYRGLHTPAASDMPADINNLTGGVQDPFQLGTQQWHVDSQSSPANSRDDLFTISQTLMANEFLELDRIVSFEDMNHMMAAGRLSQYYGANS